MELLAEDCGVQGSEAYENTPKPERPVDLVHLARYTLGDRDLESEVLELFRRQSTLYIDRLKMAKSDKAWREAAHTIKGSARSIGAWGVAGVAEKVECNQQGASNPDRDALIEVLERQISAANAYIGSLLEDN